MALSLSEANLISAFVESVLFGMRAFVPLFIGAHDVAELRTLYNSLRSSDIYSKKEMAKAGEYTGTDCIYGNVYTWYHGT